MSEHNHEHKHEHKEKHEVRIHIDRKPYESPCPTTGTALYILGKVPAKYDLYREEHGDHEDKVVPNTPHEVHLIKDEHFYSSPNSLNPGA